MFDHAKIGKKESAQAAAAGFTGQLKKKNNGGKPAPIQKQPAEDELLQGKFQIQRQPEEDELLQGSFPAQRAEVQGAANAGANSGSFQSAPGIPAGVQAKMESALNVNLSGVNVHPNSHKATEVGALAFTQGSDIHVAPGHYSPHTSSGQRLLGHELAHVAQQMAGRVQPTGEVGGLPLNDSPALEKEADILGAKAV
jgi:hypothetical protein